MDVTKLAESDGEAVLAAAGTEDELKNHVDQKLHSQTDTPPPDNGDAQGGGMVRRFNELFAPFDAASLEGIGLSGHELSDAIRTRRNELYRNKFPLLRPRFESKCENCGTEYDEDVDECKICGSDELRSPDPAEKRRAQQLFESVNKEGQSLRDVAKYAEDYQWLLGVSVLVVRHQYYQATEDAVFSPGEVIHHEPEEIVVGDPKSIKPVVDEDGRIGNYWWACPVCRGEEATPAVYDSDGYCDACDARLHEVYFAEGDSSSKKPDKVYFEHEVVTWAFPQPRLNGLDGLAPTSQVWLKQAILDFMDKYAGAFYDPDSERLPGKFMILHTTNPDHWDAQLDKAREGAKEDPYDSPIFTNEYSPQDSSTPEVQVIDTMPSELLGQNGELKSDYKSDIRQAIGISDVHDSDLEDAGGLNNEGLQLEVTDRSIASQQHDYVEGWLDELAKILNINDWKITFVPSGDREIDQLLKNIEAGRKADEAGLDATMQDGKTQVADGEFDAPEPGGAPSGGLGGGPGPPQGGNDGVEEQADARRAVDVLQDAYEHVVWADDVDGVEQKAEPFFDEDEDVPEFAKQLVNRAIQSGAVFADFDQLGAGARLKLTDFFADKLTQPQGWSLDSLANDIADEFDVDREYAEDIARNEAGNILKKSREIGYKEQGLDDEAEFKWVGPEDDRKHEACWWLLEKTNPDHGGTPRPLDELKELVQEANRRFVEGHDARDWSPHIGCRDAYVRHYD